MAQFEITALCPENGPTSEELRKKALGCFPLAVWVYLGNGTPLRNFCSKAMFQVVYESVREAREHADWHPPGPYDYWVCEHMGRLIE